MLNPGPIGHGVGIGIQGRQNPAMPEEIEPGPQMPAEIRFCQRLEREIQDKQQEQGIEGRKYVAPIHPARHASRLTAAGCPTSRLPSTSHSTSVRRKQLMASSGVQTIGSFTLNEVFSSTGTPVWRPNVSSSKR